MLSHCHLQAKARLWLVGPGPWYQVGPRPARGGWILDRGTVEVKTCGQPLSPSGLGPPVVGGPWTKEAERGGEDVWSSTVTSRPGPAAGWWTQDQGSRMPRHSLGWRFGVTLSQRPGCTRWVACLSGSNLGVWVLQVSLMTLEVWRSDGRGRRSDGPGVLDPGQERGS